MPHKKAVVGIIPGIMRFRKAILRLICCSIILASTPFPGTAAGIPGVFIFKDMNVKHWAFDEIAGLKDAGIALGYPDGSFRPDKTVSRIEFIAILARVTDKMGLLFDPDVPWDDGTGQKDTFNGFDFTRSWACGEWRRLSGRYGMAWPADVQNGDGCSSPGLCALNEFLDDDADMDGAITRFEAAAMMSPFLISEPTGTGMQEEPFTDIDYCNNKEWIRKAFNYGIIKGYPGNVFKPMSAIKRAEAFVMLARFMAKCDFIKVSQTYRDKEQELKKIFCNLMHEKYLDEAGQMQKFMPVYATGDLRTMVQDVFMLELSGKLDEACKYYTMLEYVEYFNDFKDFYMRVPENRLYNPYQQYCTRALRMFVEVIDVNPRRKLANIRFISTDLSGCVHEHTLFKFLELYEGKWMIEFNGTTPGSGGADDPILMIKDIEDFADFDNERYGFDIDFSSMGF